MKKVLVTGADGFIGSHLVELLVEKGYDVKAFVYYNSFNTWGWLDTLPKEKLDKIEVFCGDIRDPNGVREAMKGVDTVFHLAALIAIPFSYHSPDSYVDTNIKGTLNVLQAARDLKLERVLVTSTRKAFLKPVEDVRCRQLKRGFSFLRQGEYLVECFFFRRVAIESAVVLLNLLFLFLGEPITLARFQFELQLGIKLRIVYRRTINRLLHLDAEETSASCLIRQ